MLARRAYGVKRAWCQAQSQRKPQTEGDEGTGLAKSRKLGSAVCKDQ